MPSRALAPRLATSAPMANEGSAPASINAQVSIAVVVVLPWVPATPIVRRPTMTDRSPAERGHSRRPRRCASTISALSSRTAVDAMTVSTSARWSASWPTWQVMPSDRRAASTAESLASLPLTVMPCCDHQSGDRREAGAADADEEDAAELVGCRDLASGMSIFTGPPGGSSPRDAGRRHAGRCPRRPSTSPPAARDGRPAV